jgi:hypothetical protein
VKAFKRRAHHYLQRLPDEEEELEWLALMRHHGAPTRLLDWTTSPYVAAFFAVAEASERKDSAIWAIDIQGVTAGALRLLAESGIIEYSNPPDFSFSEQKIFRNVMLQTKQPSIIAPVQPLKMNERAVSQRGLFLCSNNWEVGFEYALTQVLLEVTRPNRRKEWLHKLLIGPKVRAGLLRELDRMNINYATLFPGLDGFARSLGTGVTVTDFKFHSVDDNLDLLI